MSARSVVVLLATLALGACNSLLDYNPPDQLSDDKVIKTPAGAHAALTGAYAAMQSGFYYGGTFTHFGDLYADNANHTGTFTSYQDAQAHNLFADNSDVTGMWNAIYDAIKRVNVIIERVPAVTGFAPGEQEQILGEAYFLRALHYHNLVKYYGGVPIRLVPVTDPNDLNAVNVPRATVAEVYTQILSDLAEAEARMTNVTSPDNHASLGAAKALAARVYLYQGNYAQALAKAQEVDALGYSLAPSYPDLFDNDNAQTAENIFKLTFTINQPSLLGYYWLSDQLASGAGRFEIGPTQSLINAYDTLSGDLRLAYNIHPDLNGGGYVAGTQQGGSYGTKYPTPNGGEDFHVIRYAEVVLIKAEAFARAGQLDSAVATYNLVRERAGLPDHVLGVDVVGQAAVLRAIDRERRLEFAEEGDRYPDLARAGIADSVLSIPTFRELFPIPQSEITVAPAVTQNPGY